jgi:hypothetical protein
LTGRTRETVVRFASPFRLAGFDAALPAGDYRVDHDEEAIDFAQRLAWRRVASFLHLPAIGSPAAARQMVPIDPADLDSAIERDPQS